jgi:membrane protein DedA with SNARE-associated domain
MLPVIRTFIAFPAGVARMNRTKFHVYTFIGSFPWCLGLAYVGRRLGVELLDEHSPLKQVMHKLDAVIAVVIVLAAVVFIRSRLKALRGYRDAAGSAEPPASAAKE